MLAFIDESGQPHPNDPNAYSTLVALCMHEADHRELSRQLFGAKKALLGRDKPYELKALEVLNARTFLRQREIRSVRHGESCALNFSRLDLIATKKAARPLLLGQSDAVAKRVGPRGAKARAALMVGTPRGSGTEPVGVRYVNSS